MRSEFAGRILPTSIVALLFAHAADAQGIGSFFQQGQLLFGPQPGPSTTAQPASKDTETAGPAFRSQCANAEKVFTVSCTGATELVERYGPKNCDTSSRNEYCRADRTKITVIPRENANPYETDFQVTLSDDSLQGRALSAARERAQKLTTQAASLTMAHSQH